MGHTTLLWIKEYYIQNTFSGLAFSKFTIYIIFDKKYVFKKNGKVKITKALAVQTHNLQFPLLPIAI